MRKYTYYLFAVRLMGDSYNDGIKKLLPLQTSALRTRQIQINMKQYTYTLYIRIYSEDRDFGEL